MMRATSRWSGSVREADAGFTLIEQVVVMVLGALVGTAVLSVTVTGLRSQTRVDAHQTSLEQTRVALQRLSREIRDTAPGGVDSLFDNDLTIAQDRGANAYRTLHYHVTTSGTTSQLVVDESDYSGSGCGVSNRNAKTCVRSTRATVTVLPSLANAVSAPVFTYTARAGYTSVDPDVNPSTCAWSGQTASQYAQDCPDHVTIHLEQLISGAPTTAPTDLTAEVQLRNEG